MAAAAEWDVWTTSTGYPAMQLDTVTTDETHGVRWLAGALADDYVDPDNWDDAEILGTVVSITPALVTITVDWCDVDDPTDVRVTMFSAVRVDNFSAQEDDAQYHGVRADVDGYVWDLTDVPLSFDECEERGLDGTGRS